MESNYEVVTYELDSENGLFVCIIRVESEEVINRKGMICIIICAHYLIHTIRERERDTLSAMDLTCWIDQSPM